MKSIYVNSAGISPDYDYQWKAINDNKQEVIDSPLLVKKFKNLLESKALSLLLARENNILLLLVTDLASYRKDYRSRTIRNSVAWIGETQDEPILRALAVRALQSIQNEDTPFQDDINNAINSDEKEGFKVDLNALEVNNLAKTIECEIEQKDLPVEIDKFKIAKISNERIQDLINELKQYKLPKDNGALVVVTGNKAQSTLEEAKVWRGLSKLVSSEKWVEVKTDWKKKSQIEPLKILTEQRRVLISLIGVVGVAVIITLSVILRNNLPTISGSPPTTVEVSNPYNFIPKAEDKDGDNLEFSIKNKPNWVTFDEKTGKLSGTPNPDDVGTVSDIVISVTDGEEIVTLPAFDLIVTPPTSINVNQTYSFTPVVKDLNSQNLEFSIKNKPNWATFDDNTGILSGTPNPDDIGTTSDIVISVTDGEETVNLPAFDLTVNESKP